LIGTAALFTLAFGFTLSPEFIGILIVVLLIHELGHMLGMYMFNYKDLKILFLPFLGAATFGVNRTALAHQKVLIYLLGPGPGLIIGTGFMMAYWNTHMKLFLEIGVVFLSVNMINLLPVMPLDGGQLFNLVLFQRYTFLQTGFLLFSALVAAAAGLALKDPILFFLAFFITISVPAQIRNNRALSTLRPRINYRSEILSEETLLQEIFTLLNTQPFHRLPFPKKIQTAKYLMENAQTNPPPPRTVLLSLLLYILVILSPLWVFAVAGFVMGAAKAVSFSFNA
jgi:membrane-associated protease RseP (regulator of RpoE activity)